MTPEERREIRRRGDERYQRAVAAQIGLLLSVIAAAGVAVSVVVFVLYVCGRLP